MKTSINPLKIAIVSDAIYPYNIGGKEKRIYEISTRLARRGHHVTIYTMKWWKGVNTQVRHAGVTHEAISPLYPLYSGERRSMSEAIWFALHCFTLLTKQFDVIEVDHMPHLVLFPIKLVCLLKRKKMIVTWNEVWGKTYWVKYLGKLGYIAYLIEKLSVRMPDIFISVSSHTSNRLKKEFNVTQPITTIPNGIDFSSLQSIKPSKIKTDIIYTGRLLAHKNVDNFIQAVAILIKEFPNITCRIIGNGPEEKRLKRLTKKLQLIGNIEFINFIPNNDELFKMIKSAKIFVLPSSREGFGLVVIEAQALGVPVITYNHKDNASKDFIQEGINGYLFDNRTHQLNSVLSKLLNNPLRRENIISSVKEFDWDIITERIEREYYN